jgi:ribose transport system ATP-binding protein
MSSLEELSHRHEDEAKLAESEAVPRGAPILELRGLQKKYGLVEALKPATIAFLAGEIHAIVGENGAGKSTLIKLLTGVIRRTAGDVFWCGKPVQLATPNEAISRGINAVHQEVVLCPHLSVAANMFLGDEMNRYGLMRKAAMERAAQAVLDDLGFQLPAGALLGSLTIGQQQLVATAKAAMRGIRFLIFDEPTAYLTRQESAQLFRLIRRLRDQGVTIVYISHRMEEVFELADRVSVLRDGTHVGTRLIGETNENELIALMINRSIEQIYHKEKVPAGKVIVETRGLSGPGFSDVSLSVRAGEIVGLYGLIGAGRSEFALGLYGRQPVSAGEIFWDGAKVDIRNERQAMPGDGPWHRACPGKPARPGPLPQPADRPQHQPAGLQEAELGPDDPPRRRGRECRPPDPRFAYQDAVAPRARFRHVRRQPAEDRHRQVVEPRRAAVHLRRADRRRRCRHQGGNLPPVRRTPEAGRRHHPHLVLLAGSL